VDVRLQRSVTSKVGQVRSLLRSAQLKAGSQKTKAVNRLLAKAHRKLSAMLKKARQAAKQVRHKPPRISAACLNAIEQQVGAVQTTIGELRI
jgi:hypothetical protein